MGSGPFSTSILYATAFWGVDPEIPDLEFTSSMDERQYEAALVSFFLDLCL